ncbi:MAG: mannose-6-phosphate isomerase, class I [Agriterribacter sp.]
MFKLKGKVQHYAWGGYTYLPKLLGIENPEYKPFAEYWMGAHTSSPSQVEWDKDHTTPLNKLIEEDKPKWLGDKVAKTFGSLPYLFKVLDVKDMLSIQVHPSKAEAVKGYARENEAGIPITASHRNYKDDNHKPEVMVALSEFWLLHGFKEKTLLRQTLSEVSEFSTLVPIFDKEGYFGLYKYVMELPQTEVDSMLAPLLKRSEAAYKTNQLSKAEPAYWACKTLPDSDDRYTNIDRGIFSIYFFNILQLHPGQAIFQGAGVPHAYLEGQNIELMSNSDNVLRGGLTPKHIDVPELLTHTLFEGIVADIMDGEKKGAETFYHCPVPDFIASKIELGKDEKYTHTAFSIEIILVTEGEAIITNGSQTIHLSHGESAIAGASESYTITTDTRTVLYKAGVPQN